MHESKTQTLHGAALPGLALLTFAVGGAGWIIPLSGCEGAHGLCEVLFAEIAVDVDDEKDAIGAGGEEEVLERRWAVVGIDDVAGLVVDGRDPGRETEGVRDRGREEDEADRMRQENDRLFPDHASFCAESE